MTSVSLSELFHIHSKLCSSIIVFGSSLFLISIVLCTLSQISFLAFCKLSPLKNGINFINLFNKLLIFNK